MLRGIFTPHEPCFLVLRRWQLKTHFYSVILRWVAAEFPDLLKLFYVTRLPYRIPRASRFLLHIPWFQDPVQHWSPRRYAQATRVAAQCDAMGIPIINRVDRLINATKTVGAELLTGVGIRTPRMACISNAEEFRDTLLGIGLPLLVREDWGHGGLMLRANTREEVVTLPVENFARPIAVEFIDIPSRHDGLYRKYRYVAAGNRGISHHLQVSNNWLTRGNDRIVSAQTRFDELQYIDRPDPNHEQLQCGREALGLDFVAFDYGYDYENRMVVWEANPYPFIPAFSWRRLAYRNTALDRTLAAILALYLEAGGLAIPEELKRRAAY
jgi:hypothetical protein